MKIPEPLMLMVVGKPESAVFSEEQLKQFGRDLLEAAEKDMLMKAGELGIFNHHATKRLVAVVRKLKEKL